MSIHSLYSIDINLFSYFKYDCQDANMGYGVGTFSTSTPTVSAEVDKGVGASS